MSEPRWIEELVTDCYGTRRAWKENPAYEVPWEPVRYYCPGCGEQRLRQRSDDEYADWDSLPCHCTGCGELWLLHRVNEEDEIEGRRTACPPAPPEAPVAP